MAKDYRSAVCTRSRLVLALLSLGVSLLSLMVLSTLALTAFQKYQAFKLGQRIERLKVGMSEEELDRIMGRPSSDEVVTISQGGQEKGHAQSYLRRLEYYPQSGPLLSGRYRSWVVMLDNEAGKIVEISPGGFGLVEVDYPPEFRWIAGMAIIGLALVIWLLTLRWCKKGRDTQVKKPMT